MTTKIQKRKEPNKPLGEYLMSWAVLQPALLSFDEKELKQLYRLEVKVRNREQIKMRIAKRLRTLASIVATDKVDAALAKIK